MDSEAAGQRLSAYIAALPGFVIASPGEPYGHMGATITDAVLQAGVHYETSVRPRVEMLLQRFPQARTTSAFVELLAQHDPEVLFNWHGRKMQRLVVVARFLQQEGAETEEQLARWLGTEAHRQRFLCLPGIGPKTLDYFAILAGRRERLAIDVWLTRLLCEAGLPALGYDDAQAVLQATARQRGIEASVLDHSLWLYLRQRQG